MSKKPLCVFVASAAFLEAEPLVDLGYGVTAKENATGPGYILFNPNQASNTRSIYPGAALNFVAVFRQGEDWYYYDNEVPNILTPVEDDVLVAEVDFSADTVTSLEGSYSIIHGIPAGYLSGDLTIVANRYKGVNNAGEFELSGTEIELHHPLPRWWADRQVISGNPSPLSPANLGQLKNMAHHLHAEMEALLPGAGFPLTDCFPAPPENPTQEWLDDQKKVANLGQLKHVASKFYERLNALSPDWVKAQMKANAPNDLADWPYSMPWSMDALPEENLKPATIGQLKLVFSLRLRGDLNEDGIPDLLAQGYYSDPGLDLGNLDTDGDGLTNEWELANDLDPFDKDENGNGIIDGQDDFNGDGVTNGDAEAAGGSAWNSISTASSYDTVGEGARAAYYPFDEASGSSVAPNEYSQEGDAVLVGDEVDFFENEAVNLRGNSMLFFPEGDSYIDMPAELLHEKGEFTLSFWLNPSSRDQASDTQTLLSAGHLVGSSWVSSLSVSLERVTDQLVIEGGSGSDLGRASLNWNENIWHHIIITRSQGGDSDAFQVYLNGQLIGGDSVSSAFQVSQWVIGQSLTGLNTVDPNRSFVGVIDELFVFDKILDESERLTLGVLGDVDQDGLPDWWELKYFDDLAYTGDSDPDEDGYTNEAEFALSYELSESFTYSPSDFYNGRPVTLSLISAHLPVIDYGTVSDALRFQVTHTVDGEEVPYQNGLVNVELSALPGAMLSEYIDGSNADRELRLKTNAEGQVKVYFVAPR